MSQSRQLAAIMFTDIVGYTALMGEDEQKAFELLKKNRSIQRPIIEKFNGKWLKEIGDGVLASFSTVSEAVYCAKEIQMVCQNEPDLNLKIGIHLGEVVFDEGDVFGDGVNIASRLEPLAPAGGILVSESVHKNLLNKKDIRSSFVAEKHLKNVKESVRVYQVMVDGVEPMVMKEISSNSPVTSLPSSTNPLKKAFVAIGVLLILVVSYLVYTNQDKTPVIDKPQAEITDKSIAVLPFANMSNDPEQEYFSDGMAEEIINALAQIPDLKVASRTSAFQFRGEQQDIKSIAEALGVSTILEGSVRKSNNRVRVTAQLINASDGFHLWSQTYERELNDIFIIQDELSKSIADALQMQISELNGPKVIEPTTSMEAYNLYLQGNYFLNKRNRESLDRSIEYFNQAIAVDSIYALAYGGLAISYINLGGWWFVEPSIAFPKAKKAALKALEFDSSLGLAYFALGEFQMFYEWDWKAAEESFLQAISLDPNYSHGRIWYWILLSLVDEFDKADVQIKKALELDPLSLVVNFNLASHFLQQGHYPKALEQALKTLEMDGTFAPVHWTLYNIYYAMGENDLAFEYFKKWRTSQNEDPDLLQMGYNQEGWAGVAKLIIPLLESKTTYIPSSTIAQYYIHLGNNDKALDYLENSYDQRDNVITQLRMSPIYKTLYPNPRFQALIEKMGLPPFED